MMITLPAWAALAIAAVLAVVTGAAVYVAIRRRRTPTAAPSGVPAAAPVDMERAEVARRLGDDLTAALAQLRKDVRHDARNARTTDNLKAGMAARRASAAESESPTDEVQLAGGNGRNALCSLHWLWGQLSTARFYILLLLSVGGFLLAETRAYVARLASKDDVTAAIKAELARHADAERAMLVQIASNTERHDKATASDEKVRVQLQRLIESNDAISRKLGVKAKGAK